MTIWAPIWWRAIAARLYGLRCVAHGHQVRWQAGIDPPYCPGDIVCETCHVVHWCRAHDPWRDRLID